MAPKFTIILCVMLCALLPAAVYGQEKVHNVSAGMEFEDALEVAKRCVVAATNFVDPENPKQYRKIRPQDSLEYAGISDAVRLNALRRYVVRNVDIGVQSVWGTKVGHSDPVPYLIPNSALADISRSWTLERLALEIIKNSGIPYLTKGHARGVVAACRKKILKLSTPISTDTLISTEATTAEARRDLEACLTTGGVLPGAGITDGEGDFYPYASTHIGGIIEQAIKTGSYRLLIDEIEKGAYVIFPPNIIAPRLFLKAYLQLSERKCSQRSFNFSTMCEFYELKRSTMLTDLVASPDSFKTVLNAFSETTKYKKKKNSPATPTPADLGEAVGKNPVWQTINDIERKLQNVGKKR